MLRAGCTPRLVVLADRSTYSNSWSSFLHHFLYTDCGELGSVNRIQRPEIYPGHSASA